MSNKTITVADCKKAMMLALESIADNKIKKRSLGKWGTDMEGASYILHKEYDTGKSTEVRLEEAFTELQKILVKINNKESDD